MKVSRSSRVIAALIVLISMLFVQLAVAGYACPNFSVGQIDESAPMLMKGDVPMAECTGSDAVQPSLCHASDQAESQSLDKAPVPSLQPFTTAILTLVLHNTDVINTLVENQPNPLLLSRATAPRLSIRNCCFRI